MLCAWHDLMTIYEILKKGLCIENLLQVLSRTTKLVVDLLDLLVVIAMRGIFDQSGHANFLSFLSFSTKRSVCLQVSIIHQQHVNTSENYA